ncbi:MAG: MFS transporter [Oscillospiraceae bacterium]|nr:MFS transporter [Oscillospiraceae bacterium]
MAKAPKAPKTGLTKKHWFGYMFGDWGGCMTFTLVGTVFNLYCTNALGIDPALLGILVIIWTIWDAINDPMMGALMDKAFAKHHNKRGKFRPWILRSTPLLAVTGIALWVVPSFFDGIAMLVMLFAFKVLYEAAYTMFNIPMGSLLSAMSTNDTERASLSSARGVGSMIGNMIPGLAGPAIVAFFGDRNTTGYMVAGVICAVIGFVVCFLHYACTEERNNVGPEVKADDIKFSDILVVVKKNRPFVALCVHGICICLMQYIAQTISGYMYTAVYHDLTYQSIGSALSSPFMIGAMIAVPFMCKKFGLEKLIRYSLLIGGAICGLLFVLHMVTYVNPLVHGVILGVGSGMAMVSIQMQWGLVGEAIDYNEYITGKRTEGSIYGTFNLSRRIGQTIGQGFGLFGLAWIGYEGTAEVQTAGTIFGMKVLCVLVPAIFILGSWAAFKFIWNITPEVRADMNAKKAAVAAAAVAAPVEAE